MIFLDNIKLCFIDFDDTLCVRTSRVKNNDYYECLIREDVDIYTRKSRAIGAGFHEFVKACKENNIKLFILTHSKSSLPCKTIMKYLDKTFGKGTFSDVIAVSTKEYKLNIIKEYARSYTATKSNVLFIDDDVYLVDMVYDDGFCVASPQEVALQFK